MKRKIFSLPKISAKYPEEISMWSSLTLWWLYPVMKKGCQRTLEAKDLVPIMSKHSSKALGDLVQKYWDEELKDSQLKNKNPSFLRAICRCYGLSFFLLGVMMFIEELVIGIVAPILLGFLLRYFNKEPGYADFSNGYIYGALLILFHAGTVLWHHPSFYNLQIIGMKLRIASSALIYRKALRLSSAAKKTTTVGQMVNLLSNDVNRFDMGVCLLNYLWIAPANTIIAMFFLWREIGPSSLAGMSMIIFYVPLQSFMGKQFSNFRVKIAKRTDNRVRLMNEIVSAIRVIKMYAWEKPFRNVVEIARKLEISTIMKSNYLRAVNLSLSFTSSKVMCFLSFLVYVMTGNILTAEKVFVTIVLIDNVRLTMTLFFYLAISNGSECWVSCKRIQAFLLMEEKPSATSIQVSNMKPKTSECRLSANGIVARWDDTSNTDHLHNVTFDVKAGKLLTLIGPVGSGKSSLLHAILGELPLQKGTISLQGRVSYASQEPWVFSGTVRENILFGQPFIPRRYKDVLNVCALEKDLKMFSNGDQTLVGEKGLTLSGGQRARINLARAVYCDADVYLLDDPLSAVDAHVGRHLFDKCISDFLSEKIVVLATHQQQFIKTASEIIVLRNGQVEVQGSYNEIKNQGIDFSLLQNETEVEEEKTEKTQEFSELVTETEKANDIPANITTRLRRMSQKLSSRNGSAVSLTDSVLDKRHIFREHGRKDSHISLHPEQYPYEQEGKDEHRGKSESKASGSVNFDIYVKYFTQGSNLLVFLFLIFVALIHQVAYVGIDYWLSYWTTQESEFNVYNIINVTTVTSNVNYQSEDRMFYVLIYAGILVIMLVTALMRSVIFFRSCMTSSTELHNRMFGAVLRVPMAFFESHPVGQILNRFTKDIGQVDDLLPPAMFDYLSITLQLASHLILILYINVWILLPCVLLGACFAFLRWAYLSSSREIKRLEGITRSPVFTHLSSTFEGLTTIRAFKAEESASRNFDIHQDLHSSSWVMYLASARLFGVYLDILSTVFMAAIIIGFLFMDGAVAGNVGLAISLSMSFNGFLQWGIRQSAEVESHMTSVERIIEYAKLTPEESVENKSTEKTGKSNWPNEGKITFQNVYLRYSENDSPVLKDVCFTVKPREKIGIVGRTGAGKSSLISCLFRLLNPKGTILIDGIATDSLPLGELRKSLSIIPQDPTLFSGTLRYNLDPFSQYSDDDIWNALEEVELKAVVINMNNGLSSMITEGGGNLSIGQRQLVCLARAILKHNKILIMDEATANVDPQTDSLIQRTIRRKFVDCTVMTIAHRLHTIMDSDRVMVLDAGKLEEFSQPHLLLEDSNSLFSSLVEETGTACANNLREIARQAFLERVLNNGDSVNNFITSTNIDESRSSNKLENTRL